jgi:uncharacterized Rossmann fold enzyme
MSEPPSLLVDVNTSDVLLATYEDMPAIIHAHGDVIRNTAQNGCHTLAVANRHRTQS